MKTTLKNSVAIIMLVLLPALTGAAQAGAVNYKSTYRGIQSQPVYGIATTATAPSATFQSTSAYSEQWKTDQSSMLNSDGSIANSPLAAAPLAGPRKAPNGPGTPGGDLDPTTQQPLGDAALPLLLLALAYMGIRIYRRKTT